MHAHIAVKTERRAGSPPDARVMRKVADRDACESHTHGQAELAKEHTLEGPPQQTCPALQEAGHAGGFTKTEGLCSWGRECLLAYVGDVIHKGMRSTWKLLPGAAPQRRTAAAGLLTQCRWSAIL